MTIEKLDEFASNGDKHLTGLDVATGFPRADKPERPWFNKLFGDITGKINEVVDNIDELPPFEGGVLADTFVTVNNNQTQREVNQSTARVFKTLSEMVAETKLTAESYATTLGFTEREDGGGRSYYISSEAGTLSVPLANGLHAIPSIGHEITSMDLGIARGGTGSTSVLENLPESVTKVTLIDCHLKTEVSRNITGTGKRLELVGINSRMSSDVFKVANLAGQEDIAYVFYGLRFVGFDYIKITDVTLGRPYPLDFNWYSLASAEVKVQRPELEFYQCDKVYIETTLDTYMSCYAELTEAENAYQVMASFPLVFRECKHVNTDGSTVSGKAEGEVFGGVDCGTIDFVGVYHKEIAGSGYWSIAKYIDCGTINVDRLDIESTSSGSMMDLLADNINIGSANRYKTYGKFYDITSEWSLNRQTGCGDVVIAPFEYIPINDQAYPVFNSVYELEGYPLAVHESVTIESATIKKQVPYQRSNLAFLPTTKRVVIKHVDAWDVGAFLYVVDNRDAYEIHVDLIIENIKLRNSVGNTGVTVIDACGKTEILKGDFTDIYFELSNYKKGVSLKESFEAGYVTTFYNTSFINCDLRIMGSYRFVDCTFEGTFFSRYRGIEDTIHSVVFENCKINYVTEGVVPFFLGIGVLLNTEHLVQFSNCDIFTNTKESYTYDINVLGTLIFDNCNALCLRGVLAHTNLVLKNCNSKGSLTLQGNTATPENIVSLKNNTFDTASTLDINGNKTNVNLELIGNGIPSGYDDLLVTPTFKKVTKANNYTITA